MQASCLSGTLQRKLLAEAGADPLALGISSMLRTLSLHLGWLKARFCRFQVRRLVAAAPFVSAVEVSSVVESDLVSS